MHIHTVLWVYSFSETSESVANNNWAGPFLCQLTRRGFSVMDLKICGELLLGQMSYSQKSDIYNFYHKYEKIEKKLSTVNTKKAKDLEDDVERYTYDPKKLS